MIRQKRSYSFHDIDGRAIGVQAGHRLLRYQACLAAFANGFRLELQSDGIKVTEIAPGMVDTNIRANSPHPAWAAAMQARKFSPITPDEVAESVLFAGSSNSESLPRLYRNPPHGAY